MRNVNFWTKKQSFEVVSFNGLYNAILGRPCYSKFMVAPNYVYLKLKVLGPKGIITVHGNFQSAYECESPIFFVIETTSGLTSTLVLCMR